MTILSGAVVHLGSLTFDPPPQAIMTIHSNYVIEHQIPGRDGGIIEYLGFPAPRFTLRGLFVESGAELNMLTILGMKGTAQIFSVSSTASGKYFASGSVIVEEVKFDYKAGHNYPYYGYVIDLIQYISGIKGGVVPVPLQSNVQIGAGFGSISFGTYRHQDEIFVGQVQIVGGQTRTGPVEIAGFTPPLLGVSAMPKTRFAGEGGIRLLS